MGVLPVEMLLPVARVRSEPRPDPCESPAAPNVCGPQPATAILPSRNRASRREGVWHPQEDSLMHARHRLPRWFRDGASSPAPLESWRQRLPPGRLLSSTLLAGALLGAAACDLNLGYEGTAVAELTPVQQIRFCDDAALQMARTYVGSFKALCGLSALDPATCVENFDTCAADYDPDMMTDRSKGVVAGEARCLELFEEGAFASCQIDAGLYVACATETAAYLAALDGEQVCSAPPTGTDTGETDASETADAGPPAPSGDAGEAGDAGPTDDAGSPPPNEHTPSCAEMERLCADNPFTPATIREAAEEYDAEASGDAGVTDASPADADPEPSDG